MPWEEHEGYLCDEARPGQHVSIFAPTESGKTYLIRYGLLEPLWTTYPVLYLDVKRKARTIVGMGQEVREFPGVARRLKWRTRPLDSARWHSDPQWFRLRPPNYRWSEDGRRQDDTWRRARRVVGEAIDRAMHEGGWVLVADDVQTITEPRAPSLDLAAPMIDAWRNGREAPVTVIAATQAPAGAPSQMYDQATFMYFGQTTDVRRQIRLGEIGGGAEEIEATLPHLGPHEFLYVRRGGRDMQVIEVPRRRRAA